MPEEVRVLDNRNALLFRGERAVQDAKYDLMRHPNISQTTDSGWKMYFHGLAPNALDPEDILLEASYSDYEVLSEEELNELLKNKDMENKK